MKYDVRQLPLISNREIAQGIFDMRLAYQQADLPVRCGQFAHVYVPGKTLRRPISVCDASDNELRLVYQIKGEGTKLMAQMQSGAVDVLVPLGNGFDIQSGKRYCLIGGGIGVPPMLYTAKQCDAPLIITGFRTKSLVILQEDLRTQGETLLCTDDGSAGQKGFVTDLLRARIGEVDEVCACGPTPMLKAVAAVCREYGKPCQVSLEERMGCGVGACLVCAVKVRKNGEEVMQHVCKNGPVFNAEEVVF